MTDAKIAGELAGFATASLKSVDSISNLLKAFTLYFLKILDEQESRQQLIDFYQAGLEQDTKLGPDEKLSMISYTISPNYAKPLYEICNREHIGHINTQTNTFDLVMDGKGDNIKGINDAVWIYSTQQKEFHRAVAEAKARSGYEQEIPREMANTFLNKLIKEKNLMLEIKEIPLERYIDLRRDIQKLNPDMRFTLFPKYYEKDGTKLVDIGFLSRTEKLYDMKGNAFVEPKQYNIAELVKGLLLKQQLMIKNDNSKKYFDLIIQNENLKQNTINELLKTRPTTINSVKKEIETLKADDLTKFKLDKLLQKYNQDPDVKQELITAIKYVETMDLSSKNQLLKHIEELGNEMYIIPVHVIKESGELEYEVSTNDSICLGKDLTIRSTGKEDLIIEDESSLRDNLDRKITEFTEKGKENGKEYSFVVLNANEFRGVEMGKSEFIGFNNRLKKKNILFLKEHDNPDLFNEGSNTKEIENSAETIIKTILENKEQFIFKSRKTKNESNELDQLNIDQGSIIGALITKKENDQNEKMEIESRDDEINIKDAITEIDEVKIVPAGKHNGFVQYIDTQIDSTENNSVIELTTNDLIR